MIRIWYDEMVCGPRYILIGYIVFKNVQNMYQAIQPTIKRNGILLHNYHGLDTDKFGENCHLFNTL